MKVVAAVIALSLVVASAAACGPGAGDQVRSGARPADPRNDRTTKDREVRSEGGGSSSTIDRSSRSHVGNGKR